MFSDASQSGCAYVVAQCKKEEMDKSPTERKYSLLTVWSRSWSGPETRWSVGEWELYPLHHAVTRNDWLFVGRVPTCYVDHSNLIPLLRNPS